MAKPFNRVELQAAIAAASHRLDEQHRLIPVELDLPVRIENAARYTAQSAATKDGQVAELPPRSALPVWTPARGPDFTAIFGER